MSLHLNSAKDEITWMSTMDHSKWSCWILSNWHEPAWSLLRVNTRDAECCKYNQQHAFQFNMSWSKVNQSSGPDIGMFPNNWPAGNWQLTHQCLDRWRIWELSDLPVPRVSPHALIIVDLPAPLGPITATRPHRFMRGVFASKWMCKEIRRNSIESYWISTNGTKIDQTNANYGNHTWRSWSIVHVLYHLHTGWSWSVFPMLLLVNFTFLQNPPSKLSSSIATLLCSR